MSAHPVPPSSLLTAFAVTAALAWSAAGRRRGPLAVASGLTAVQGVLHLILGAGEHPGPTGADPMAAMPGMTHTADASHLAGAAMSGPMGSDSAAGSGAGMLAAHLLAALACGLWLARGEAALFALARTAGARAAVPLRLLLAAVRVRVPAPPRARRPLRPARRTRRPRGVLLAHTVSRRGPPSRPAPRATALGAHV
ncbi:hypothetical protein ABZV60_21810 [Streptomyces sp. NPDC004787]|uniref:hypothetical protein n=1 Tax=Streptomyces sp. NPDC004787 TaxID=3154291 RepID=UPI0033BB6837